MLDSKDMPVSIWANDVRQHRDELRIDCAGHDFGHRAIEYIRKDKYDNLFNAFQAFVKGDSND